MSEHPRSAKRVLVVDDSDGIRAYLADLVEGWGYVVDTAPDGERALEMLEAGASPDLMLLDVMLPGIDGVETLRRAREMDPMLPVVMVSVASRASIIVEAMRCGAADFVGKPFDEAALEQTVRQAIADRTAAQTSGPASQDSEALWDSAAMSQIGALIDQIGDTDVTVLIQGESGVGKEIVARAVHERSMRSDGCFVKVNCAALPEDLLESELFGYERGAFTGATSRKIGKFEIADGGTIFLDEIGEMSPGLQAKLLQVLQDRRFPRLGGNEEIEVDVRVVCATHRPLVEMVEKNRFRDDLYFRLNVVNVQIPPLRERREEIPRLVDHFNRHYSKVYDRPERQITPGLMAAFAKYPFPGNVRELENMMKRIIVLESEDTVLAEIAGNRSGNRRLERSFLGFLHEIEASAGDVPLREVGRRAALQVEREAISAALEHTGWNRKRAAGMLGVSYKTLLQKIRECELEVA